MLMKISCFAAVISLLILPGCNKSTSLTEQIIELQNSIHKIEQQCIPQQGTSRYNVEIIFGPGIPLLETDSKLPPEESAKDESLRRAYQLCENGTLVVLYDSDWKVLSANYLNPYSIKGSSYSWKPTDKKLTSELEPRLKQMEIILEVYNSKQHEAYLFRMGNSIMIYLGDNNDKYPENLKEFILWIENTTSGDDPNKIIESWLNKCVCPLTNHKPHSLDNVDEWSDIKLAPSYPSVTGENIIAYCPAENHPDNKVYVMIHHPIKNATSFRQHFIIKSVSQEEFDKMLEEQYTNSVKVNPIK